jgi:hypothetical protein
MPSFVMMTGSTITKEGPHMGSVWRLLDKYKHDRGIEYCFIKATWFMGEYFPVFEVQIALSTP